MRLIKSYDVKNTEILQVMLLNMLFNIKIYKGAEYKEFHKLLKSKLVKDNYVINKDIFVQLMQYNLNEIKQFVLPIIKKHINTITEHVNSIFNNLDINSSQLLKIYNETTNCDSEDTVLSMWKDVLKNCLISSSYKLYFKKFPKVNKLQDTLDLEDEIGDVILPKELIDVSKRDLPFIYANGEIIWGQNSQHHKHLLNQAEAKYREDAFANVKNDFESLGFGHYQKGIAAIDNYSRTNKNVILEDVKNALLTQTDMSIVKIYEQSMDKTLTRIAKFH